MSDVLVVGNSRYIKNVRKQLSKKGYTIETVPSFEAAQELINSSRKYRVILTEYLLPLGKNGKSVYELAKRMCPEAEPIVISKMDFIRELGVDKEHYFNRNGTPSETVEIVERHI